MQFSATLRGWVTLFYNIDGHTFKSSTNRTVDHTVLIYKTQPAEITAKNTLKSVVSFIKYIFNKMYDFFFYISLLFKILMP